MDGRCLLFASFAVLAAISAASAQNNPPQITIVAPLTNSQQVVNGFVPFRINVSDDEDGSSAYGEIPAHEVMLEVRYVAPGTAPSPKSAPQAGLATMQESNCFSCHAFNGKLIAPSFAEIAKRYPLDVQHIQQLARKIRAGTAGAWGTATMPSHPEISETQAQEIVQWILYEGSNTALQIYTGTEGTIRLKLPEGASPHGLFLLTATYVDHGTKSDHTHRARGSAQATLILK